MSEYPVVVWDYVDYGLILLDIIMDNNLVTQNLVSFIVKAQPDEVLFLFGVLKNRPYLSSMVMNAKRGLLGFIIKPYFLSSIKKFLGSRDCVFYFEYF